MPKIYIMRHADAKSIKHFSFDRERSLSEKGREELIKIKPRLKDAFSDVSLVLCSAAVRTRETLAGIIDILPEEAKIIYSERLYNATADTLLEEINTHGDHHTHILLVGHNPGVSEFLANVPHKISSGILGIDMLTMPTASVVTYDCHKHTLHLVNYHDLIVDEVLSPHHCS